MEFGVSHKNIDEVYKMEIFVKMAWNLFWKSSTNLLPITITKQNRLTVHICKKTK